jgi:LuxR family maltose regulon positive regulatory protein
MQEAEKVFADLLARGGDVRLLISRALAYRLRFWLAQGKLEAAASWLAENNVGVDLAISPGDEWFHLLLARILIEQEHLDNAQKQLERLEEIARTRKSPRLAVETSILRALYSQARGEHDLAVRSLSQALLLAEPEGYQRIFLDDGESLTELLNEVVRGGETTAYARDILAAIHGEQQSRIGAVHEGANGRTAAIQESAQTGLIEPLTEREQRILQLLAAKLSNREIAAELFLSINTIKTYTSRIYDKLGVHSRTEAVDRAYELGLL